MSYAIIRNANYKKDNLAGLYKHNERKNTNYSNKDINKNNSIKKSLRFLWIIISLFFYVVRTSMGIVDRKEYPPFCRMTKNGKSY